MNPSNEELNNLFEKIASNDCSLAERDFFFAELENDPILKEAYQNHLHFRKGIEIVARRSAMRKQIQGYHEGLSKVKKTSNPISISRWAVAASISALVIVASWLGYEWEQRNKMNGEQLLARSTNAPRKIHHRPSTINQNEEEELLNSGTAFAINSEGYFLTTSHIVGSKSDVVLENPEEGISYQASVVARDARYDLVLLKIDDEQFKGLGKIPYAIKKEKASLAQRVFTLGFPKEDVVFGEGSVSSLSGYNGDTLKYQLSVPVNPGQSGSPLFDEKGNLIGVISAKNGGADGESYAVKSKYLIHFIQEGIEDPIQLPKVNALQNLPITKKIQKVSPYIFIVRA